MAILDVLMRYLHIMSAVLAVGGAFFLLVLLPGGLRLVDEPRRDEVLLKIRRAYKLTVHPCILGLLVSGVYNTVRLWPAYKLNTARHHSLWGPHLLLGLAVMGISLWLLAGSSLRTNHRKWLKVNIALMFVVVLLSSTLRWVRLDTAAARMATLQEENDRLKAGVPMVPTRPADAAPAAVFAPPTQPAGAP